VEDRECTGAGPVAEDGHRLLARPRDGARDPDLAFRDDEQAVAGLAFLEDVLPDGEFLLPAHLGDASELPVVQVLEDRRLFHQLEIHGGEATNRVWEGQVERWVPWADRVTALRCPLGAA